MTDTANAAATPDLHSWFLERLDAMEASNLRGKHAWSRQIMFMRDEARRLLEPHVEHDQRHEVVRVASTHTSKSCELPVYHIQASSGLELWLRGNFHDWKISVRSPVEVDDVFFDLFDRGDGEPIWHKFNPVYFEGFRDEWVFGPYADNHREFTVELGANHHQLWTFLFLLTRTVAARQAAATA